MVQSTHRRALWWPWRAGLLGLTACISVATADPSHSPRRTANAATIVLASPDSLGSPERPPVGFPHDVHTAAMVSTDGDTSGCGACHDRDDKRRLLPRFKLVGAVTSLEELGEQFHAGCLGCHEERLGAGLASGPVGCGECHERAPITPPRAAMRFDYSLHARHVKAAEDRCETCHHVYNEVTRELEPGKGVEGSCRDCHGAADDGKRLSLRNAMHTDCVSCHLERLEKEQAGKQVAAGPIDCLGCHDEVRQMAIAKLDSIPRLQRGQPDELWLRVAGGTAKLVPFNHRRHEEQGQSCATCHHRTMQACVTCHALTAAVEGAVEGSSVTLVQAFHDPNATQSCVGCHQQEVEADPNCGGCHRLQSGAPGTESCEICHRGPRLAKGVPIPVQDTPEKPAYLTVAAGLPVRDFLEPVPAPPLPATSDDFPDSLRIDVLASEYRPAPLPHRRIVQALATAIGESALARRFHRPADSRICAGCHHRSPVGERPPACLSCHSETDHPTADQPRLLAAYHRQCISCHQVMGHSTECVKCHQPATEEPQP